MIYWLVKWLVSALLLLIVSYIVPGFEVDGFGSAMVAALLIGIVNATIGFFLKVITFPLTLITFGIFLLVINAIMLLFVSSLVRGFVVRGFAPAFWGALLLALLGMLTRWWFVAV